jgi:hypothetical protein
MDISPFKREDQRSPVTETIDEIGTDLKIIKGIGVEHIISGYNFYL